MPRQPQGNVEIELLSGDVLEVEAEAVVVPTTTTGALTSYLGERILRMGGKAIQDEAMDVAPIAIGAAIVTDGGPVGDKKLIHVPVALTPVDKLGIENVRRATKAALVAAHAKEFHVIAMPPLCRPGDGGMTSQEIARAMIDEIRAHKYPLPEKVRYVLLDDEMLQIATRIMETLK